MNKYTVLIRLPVGDHEFILRAESREHAMRLAAQRLDARGFKVRDIRSLMVMEDKESGGKP